MAVRRKSSICNINVGDENLFSTQQVSVTASRRSRPVKRGHGSNNLKRQSSVSDLLTKMVLHSDHKENDYILADDFRNKPDLWMAAFDNPADFIQYCRKRLDHERHLMEKSRKVEKDMVQVLNQWSENSGRYNRILEDLFKVQNINDKLQEVVMEERTHCQHLIGVNDQLETQRKIMARKYHAALLLGKVDAKSVEHLLEKDPKVVPLADQVFDLSEKIKKYDSKTKKKPECTDPVILADKVTRMEEYVENLKKQHLEEVTVLKDIIDKNGQKYECISNQYEELLKRNGKALEEVKGCLSAVVRENMDLRFELLKKDDKFMQVKLDEIKAATRKRPGQNTSSINEISQAFEEATAIEKDLKIRLAEAEIELVEKSNVLREVLNKMLMLERTSAKLKEDKLFLLKQHENCVAALKSRNEILQKRVEKSEKRRKFDNAGFRADIGEMRHLLKNFNNNTVKFLRMLGKNNVDREKYWKPTDEDLERLRRTRMKVSRRSVKKILRETGPAKMYHVMKVWSEFLDRKMDNLGRRLSSTKKEKEVVVLYDSKDKMKQSSGSVYEGISGINIKPSAASGSKHEGTSGIKMKPSSGSIGEGTSGIKSKGEPSFDCAFKGDSGNTAADQSSSESIISWGTSPIKMKTGSKGEGTSGIKIKPSSGSIGEGTSGVKSKGEPSFDCVFKGATGNTAKDQSSSESIISLGTSATKMKAGSKREGTSGIKIKPCSGSVGVDTSGIKNKGKPSFDCVFKGASGNTANYQSSSESIIPLGGSATKMNAGSKHEGTSGIKIKHCSGSVGVGTSGIKSKGEPSFDYIFKGASGNTAKDQSSSESVISCGISPIKMKAGSKRKGTSGIKNKPSSGCVGEGTSGIKNKGKPSFDCVFRGASGNTATDQSSSETIISWRTSPIKVKAGSPDSNANMDSDYSTDYNGAPSPS